MQELIPYNSLFSLTANFHKWCTPTFRRNFLDLEIQQPTTEKSYVRDILYKVYIGKTQGKTVICYTRFKSTIIIASVCVWTPRVCIHVLECLRIHDLVPHSTYVQKSSLT